MRNGSLSLDAAATQMELKQVIRAVEQPLINLIAMADILHDGLLFRADHPGDKRASSYDGAVHLAGEIHSWLMCLHERVTSSPAFGDAASDR